MSDNLNNQIKTALFSADLVVTTTGGDVTPTVIQPTQMTGQEKYNLDQRDDLSVLLYSVLGTVVAGATITINYYSRITNAISDYKLLATETKTLAAITVGNHILTGFSNAALAYADYFTISVTLKEAVGTDYTVTGQVIVKKKSEIVVADEPDLVAALTLKQDVVLTLPQAVATTGGVINLKPGAAYICDNISLVSNTRIIGNGATITATGNNSCFVADSKSNITIEDVCFVGTGDATQKLVSFTRTTDYDSIKIKDCKFKTASGVGLYFIGCGYITRKPSFVTDCEFDTCGIGIQTDTRAEFITISNCHFHHCSVGVQKKSGNIDIVGCNFLANTTAIKYINGTNEAHSNIKSCAFEHNTTQILATGVLITELIADCRFFEGNIDLVDCVNWLFSDCYIAVTKLRFDTCINAKFQGCIFNKQGDGYGNTITTAWDSDSSGGSHVSQVWWLNNSEETAAGVRSRLEIGGGIPTGVVDKLSGLQIWEKNYTAVPAVGTLHQIAHGLTIVKVVDLKGVLDRGSGDVRQFPAIATTSNYMSRYISGGNLNFTATSGYFDGSATLYATFTYTNAWT